MGLGWIFLYLSRRISEIDPASSPMLAPAKIRVLDWFGFVWRFWVGFSSGCGSTDVCFFSNNLLLRKHNYRHLRFDTRAGSFLEARRGVYQALPPIPPGLDKLVRSTEHLRSVILPRVRLSFQHIRGERDLINPGYMMQGCRQSLLVEGCAPKPPQLT